jgi:hypothetical protein
MRPALVVALLLLASSAGAQTLWLDARVVFPGGDGADPETLAVPLASRIAAFLKDGHRTHFRKRMVIHKAARRLDVFADETLLKSYLINLGPTPEGPKEHQGDGRTPEGDLFICSVNRVSHYTRFLALAYPTPADAQRGLQSRLLTPAQAREVESSFRIHKGCPPQQTQLGGQVGIHGKGDWQQRGDRFGVVDWTLGCVGLRDADILELFEGYAEVGLPVRIEP